MVDAMPAPCTGSRRWPAVYRYAPLCPGQIYAQIPHIHDSRYRTCVLDDFDSKLVARAVHGDVEPRLAIIAPRDGHGPDLPDVREMRPRARRVLIASCQAAQRVTDDLRPHMRQSGYSRELGRRLCQDGAPRRQLACSKLLSHAGCSSCSPVCWSTCLATSCQMRWMIFGKR